MSIALAGHVGPWTIDDVEGLPDNGDHTRYELLTPGVLTVTPAPGTVHQRASRRLANLLEAAIAAAKAPYEVLETVNVEIPGGRLTEPDVVVVDRAVSATAPSRYQGASVLLVVEIVSPNTHPQDRIIKPELYAEAGIDFYWRLELEKRPHLIASKLSNGKYRRTLTALGGVLSTVEEPYPMQVDPAALARQ
ncbi:Uma2 family endonuclease [Kribbella sp. NPDC056345]|uniref:Uma2 family endonuclease n=1 Tax=Kribbella sp. NPDC056345 TaxID=3345789 RepID=UPI0035D9DF90